MADESVRSLLATLGFELDSTKADQFEARFKKLESTIGTIAKRIDSFKPKFDGPGGAKKGKKFGNRIKKAFLKALKLDKGLPGFTKSLRAGLGKAFKFARIAAIAGAAAIVATVGKGLLKFTDVQGAKFALRFQAENLGVDFDKILEKLKDVREETGNVVDELDTLQALNVGFQLTGNFENVAENMASVIKFASVLNKDLSEVQQTFSEFVLTGGNLADLKKFGFFDQAQIEALKKAGTGFGPIAERERTRLLDVKIAEQIDRLNKAFKEFGGTNAAFIAKMKVLASEGLVKVGKGVTRDLRKAAEFLGITTETPREIINTIQVPISKEQALQAREAGLQRRKEFLDRPTEPSTTNKTNTVNQTNTINQNNTININGADTEKVRKVVGEVIKDAAQIELRKTPDKALPIVGD